MDSKPIKIKFVLKSLMKSLFGYILICLIFILYQCIYLLQLLIDQFIITIILIVFIIILIFLIFDIFIHFRRVFILQYQDYVLRHATSEWYGSIHQRHRAYDKLQAFKIDKCSICCNKFNFKMHKIKLLKCGHIYHEECINKNEHNRWITNKDKNYKKSKCPLCRKKYRIIKEKFNYQHNYYQINNRIFSFYFDGLHEKKSAGNEIILEYIWMHIYGLIVKYQL